MSVRPRAWTAEQLEHDARLAAASFRSERLAATDDWDGHVHRARASFEKLFLLLGDLGPGTIDDDRLVKAFGKDLRDPLRYLAGPPISEDDLRVLADVESTAPAALRGDPVALRKVFEIIERVVDPHRFPWARARAAATPAEREAALLASSVLLAAQRLETERRNEGKLNQEARVATFLRDRGFEQVAPAPIRTLVDGPDTGQFCAECLLGERKADLIVRLHDTRLLAIECKVSNSATNSVKRLNNDAAVKAEYWIKQFGKAQIVPAAVLAGVFKVLNLEQAQERGLALFWSHDLDKLGAFIAMTG